VVRKVENTKDRGVKGGRAVAGSVKVGVRTEPSLRRSSALKERLDDRLGDEMGRVKSVETSKSRDGVLYHEVALVGAPAE
jgi:hypothetical protein